MKLTAVLLLLILCITGFFSCGGSGEPEETSPPAPTELAVVTGGVSDFSIVRADNGSNTVVSAAVELRKSIEAASGVKLTLTTDWEDNPIAEHELIVGKTTRDILSGGIDRSAIGETGFIIREKDGRIFITGGSDKGTQLGVNYFLDAFVKKGADIRVPIGFEHIVYHQYDITGLYVGMNPVDESWLVVYESDTDRAAAITLRDAIGKKTGILMNVTKGSARDCSFFLSSEKPSPVGVHEMHADGSMLVLSSSAATGLSGCVSDFLKNYLDGKIGQFNFPADFRYLEIGDYLTVTYPEG